jgi:hypothetical protein
MRLAIIGLVGLSALGAMLSFKTPSPKAERALVREPS